MRKLILVLMFVCFMVPVMAQEYGYLEDYCWQIHYQIYPPINGEVWIKGPALIFSSDGTILNENRNRILGKWYPNQNPKFVHIWLNSCGKIKGWLLFEENSSILKGCATQFHPKQKGVSILLVRNYRIKNLRQE